MTAAEIQHRLPALGRHGSDHSFHCLIRRIGESRNIVRGDVPVGPSGPFGVSKFLEFTHDTPYPANVTTVAPVVRRAIMSAWAVAISARSNAREI